MLQRCADDSVQQERAVGPRNRRQQRDSADRLAYEPERRDIDGRQDERSPGHSVFAQVCRGVQSGKGEARHRYVVRAQARSSVHAEQHGAGVL